MTRMITDADGHKMPVLPWGAAQTLNLVADTAQATAVISAGTKVVTVWSPDAATVEIRFAIGADPTAQGADPEPILPPNQAIDVPIPYAHQAAGTAKLSFIAVDEGAIAYVVERS